MSSDFVVDNTAYETWLRTRCDVVEEDLEHKHQRMAKGPFEFLRATYFRWAKRIAAVCPEACQGPGVLSIGDIHIENFGTWRDADARLVWGVNDFDEAAVMPFPLDLVRLTTSVRLAPGLQVDGREAADAILTGYRRGLASPRPTVVHEQAAWILELVGCVPHSCAAFYSELEGYLPKRPPDPASAALMASLPGGTRDVRFAARRKGGGSLGRPRYVASGSWQGATVVREAKAWVPSAWGWAHGWETVPAASLALATGRTRSPDPVLDVQSNFTIRRLAPDSRKIELGDDAGKALGASVLDAMGFDVGSVHCADALKGPLILADLDRRSADWLDAAAKGAEVDVRADFNRWIGR